jgi:hypothetical protein
MRHPKRIGWLLAAISLAGAGVTCAKTKPTDESGSVNGAAGQSVTSKPSIAADHPASTPTGRRAKAPRITSALGTEVVQSLVAAIGAEAAWLRVIPVGEAERQALGAQNRIVGYPIVTALRSIVPSDASRLLDVLIRDDSYDFELRLRCVNKRLLGVRFLVTPPVEFALGTPCNQAIWTFKRADKTERWGALLSDKAAESIRLMAVAGGSPP